MTNQDINLSPEIEEQNKAKDKTMFNQFALGTLVGSFITGSAAAVGIYLTNSIPNLSNVQSGYIAPSQLRVRTADLDKNGELETIMQVDGKDYLLREVNGRPLLSPYTVEPAKIVPQN